MSFLTKNNGQNLRAILALALFASYVFAPPWLAAIFACTLAARWRAWEVIAAGIFADFLWMSASTSFLSLHVLPWITIISTIVVFGCEPLRRRLLLGPQIL